ncbi:MAG: pitrilysin family protein [SAR324 cluster bacterium]|nr:pitrilysin family protein [SAR324 cluster bacterium]
MSPCLAERLPNGFTTAIIEMPGRHQVLAALLVRNGSRFEAPEQSGVSHLLEHIVFRGCEAYPDARLLNLAFEEAGSIPDAATGVEATEFSFTAHPERLQQGLSTLAEMVRRPTFAQIEREREIVLDEILYDYNGQGELVNLGALSAQLLWPGQGLGQHVIGTHGSVANLDAAQLRAHHKAHYTPGNLVLGLAGNLDPAQGFALARACFGDMENGMAQATNNTEPAMITTAPEPSPGPLIKLVPDADNQFHLQLSFSAAGYNDPDEFALSLLPRILDDGPTSRLQQTLREDLALAYHVGADYTAYQDAGQLDIVTTVKAAKLQDMLTALLDCLAKFRDEGPRPEELAGARRRHRFDLEFGRDSLEAQIVRHVWPLLYSTPRLVEEELRLLEAVTLEELHGLARQVFTASRLHLVLVGPVDAHTERMVSQTVARF